jgi:hypothetical protein
MTDDMRAHSLSATSRFALSSLLCLLACLVLTAPGCRKKAAPDLEGLPQGSFDRLTEDNISRVVAVAPAMRKLALNSDARPGNIKMTDGIPEYLSKMVDWLHDVPGSDSVLAAAGLTWPAYRVILYRVYVTALSIGAPRVTRVAEGHMAELNVGERKNLRRQIAQTKRIIEHVPKDNRDIFTRHQRELFASLPGSGE